jgi:RHS repeat-associated protein
MSGSSNQTARGSLSTETTNNKTVTTAGVTTTTQYLVEDDVNPTGYPQVLDELTGPIGSAAVTRTYTYGLQRISQDQIAGNVLSYYQYDGGGSVRQLTNSVGQVTDSYEYDAFGNSFTKVGTTPNNYLYRGEQFDSDLGLYYLRARYYNPATGRFLSRDPLVGQSWDPKSLHKYLYAGGDPVNAEDPTGKGLVEDAWNFAKSVALYVATKKGLCALFSGLAASFWFDSAFMSNNPTAQNIVGSGLGGGFTLISLAFCLG